MTASRWFAGVWQWRTATLPWHVSGGRVRRAANQAPRPPWNHALGPSGRHRQSFGIVKVDQYAWRELRGTRRKIHVKTPVSNCEISASLAPRPSVIGKLKARTRRTIGRIKFDGVVGAMQSNNEVAEGAIRRTLEKGSGTSFENVELACDIDPHEILTFSYTNRRR